MKKNITNKTLNTVFILATVIIAAADQLTKYYINSLPENIFPLEILPNVIQITRISNTGIAFGMFQNITTILLIISVVAVFLIIVIKIKLGLNSLLFHLGLGLLLGGTLGNFIDRLLKGEVTDFISINFFAVINVADIFINVGFGIIAVLLIKMQLQKNPPKNKDKIN